MIIAFKTRLNKKKSSTVLLWITLISQLKISLIYGLRNEITLKIIKLYIEPWVRQNDAILKKNYKLFARKTALLQKDKMQNVKCIKLYFKKLDLH